MTPTKEMLIEQLVAAAVMIGRMTDQQFETYTAACVTLDAAIGDMLASGEMDSTITAVDAALGASTADMVMLLHYYNVDPGDPSPQSPYSIWPPNTPEDV